MTTDEQAGLEWLESLKAAETAGKIERFAALAGFKAGAQHGRKAALADLTEDEATKVGTAIAQVFADKGGNPTGRELALAAFSTLQRLRGR